MSPSRSRDEAIAALLAEAVPDGECLLIPAGGQHRRRYPTLNVDGRTRPAGRVLLERKLGRPIHPGYICRHTCDRHRRVNDAHLVEGTPAENMQDRWKRTGYREKDTERWRQEWGR